MADDTSTVPDEPTRSLFDPPGSGLREHDAGGRVLPIAREVMGFEERARSRQGSTRSLFDPPGSGPREHDGSRPVDQADDRAEMSPAERAVTPVPPTDHTFRPQFVAPGVIVTENMRGEANRNIRDAQYEHGARSPEYAQAVNEAAIISDPGWIPGTIEEAEEAFWSGVVVHTGMLEVFSGLQRVLWLAQSAGMQFVPDPDGDQTFIGIPTAPIGQIVEGTFIEGSKLLQRLREAAAYTGSTPSILGTAATGGNLIWAEALDWMAGEEETEQVVRADGTIGEYTSRQGRSLPRPGDDLSSVGDWAELLLPGMGLVRAASSFERAIGGQLGEAMGRPTDGGPASLFAGHLANKADRIRASVEWRMAQRARGELPEVAPEVKLRRRQLAGEVGARLFDYMHSGEMWRSGWNEGRDYFSEVQGMLVGGMGVGIPLVPRESLQGAAGESLKNSMAERFTTGVGLNDLATIPLSAIAHAAAGLMPERLQLPREEGDDPREGLTFNPRGKWIIDAAISKDEARELRDLYPEGSPMYGYYDGLTTETGRHVRGLALEMWLDPIWLLGAAPKAVQVTTNAGRFAMNADIVKGANLAARLDDSIVAGDLIDAAVAIRSGSRAERRAATSMWDEAVDSVNRAADSRRVARDDLLEAAGKTYDDRTRTIVDAEPLHPQPDGGVWTSPAVEALRDRPASLRRGLRKFLLSEREKHIKTVMDAEEVARLAAGGPSRVTEYAPLSELTRGRLQQARQSIIEINRQLGAIDTLSDAKLLDRAITIARKEAAELNTTLGVVDAMEAARDLIIGGSAITKLHGILQWHIPFSDVTRNVIPEWVRPSFVMSRLGKGADRLKAMPPFESIVNSAAMGRVLTGGENLYVAMMSTAAGKTAKNIADFSAETIRNLGQTKRWVWDLMAHAVGTRQHQPLVARLVDSQSELLKQQGRLAPRFFSPKREILKRVPPALWKNYTDSLTVFLHRISYRMTDLDRTVNRIIRETNKAFNARRRAAKEGGPGVPAKWGEDWYTRQDVLDEAATHHEAGAGFLTSPKGRYLADVATQISALKTSFAREYRIELARVEQAIAMLSRYMVGDPATFKGLIDELQVAASSFRMAEDDLRGSIVIQRAQLATDLNEFLKLFSQAAKGVLKPYLNRWAELDAMRRKAESNLRAARRTGDRRLEAEARAERHRIWQEIADHEDAVRKVVDSLKKKKARITKKYPKDLKPSDVSPSAMSAVEAQRLRDKIKYGTAYRTTKEMDAAIAAADDALRQARQAVGSDPSNKWLKGLSTKELLAYSRSLGKVTGDEIRIGSAALRDASEHALKDLRSIEEIVQEATPKVTEIQLTKHTVKDPRVARAWEIELMDRFNKLVYPVTQGGVKGGFMADEFGRREPLRDYKPEEIMLAAFSVLRYRDPVPKKDALITPAAYDKMKKDWGEEALMGQRLGEIPNDLKPIVAELASILPAYEGGILSEGGRWVMDPFTRMVTHGVINYVPHIRSDDPTAGKTGAGVASHVRQGTATLDEISTQNMTVRRRREIAGTIAEINNRASAGIMFNFELNGFQSRLAEVILSLTASEFFFMLMKTGGIRSLSATPGKTVDVVAAELGMIPVFRDPTKKFQADTINRVLHGNIQELLDAGIDAGFIRQLMEQIKIVSKEARGFHGVLPENRVLSRALNDLRRAEKSKDAGEISKAQVAVAAARRAAELAEAQARDYTIPNPAAYASWMDRVPELVNAKKIDRAIMWLRADDLEKGTPLTDLRMAYAHSKEDWDAVAKQVNQRLINMNADVRVQGQWLERYYRPNQELYSLYIHGAMAESLGTNLSQTWSSKQRGKGGGRAHPLGEFSAGVARAYRTQDAYWKMRATVNAVAYHTVNLMGDAINTVIDVGIGGAFNYHTQKHAMFLTAMFPWVKRYGSIENAMIQVSGPGWALNSNMSPIIRTLMEFKPKGKVPEHAQVMDANTWLKDKVDTYNAMVRSDIGDKTYDVLVDGIDLGNNGLRVPLTATIRALEEQGVLLGSLERVYDADVALMAARRNAHMDDADINRLSKALDLVRKHGDNLIDVVLVAGSLHASGGLPFILPTWYGKWLAEAQANQGRLVNFIANYKRTGSWSIAKEHVDRYLFDYNSLTTFQKRYLRHSISFFTWGFKSAHQHVKFMWLKPWVFKIHDEIFNQIIPTMIEAQEADREAERLSEALGKEVDTSVEPFYFTRDNLLRQWRHTYGHFKWPVPGSGMMITRTKFPMEDFMDKANMLGGAAWTFTNAVKIHRPDWAGGGGRYERVARLAAAGGDKTQYRILSQMSFLGKAIAQYGSGIDFFTGQPIEDMVSAQHLETTIDNYEELWSRQSDVTGLAPFPREWIEDALGFRRVSTGYGIHTEADHRYVFLSRNHPWSRSMNDINAAREIAMTAVLTDPALTQQAIDEDDFWAREFPIMTARVMFGFKVYRDNPEWARQRNESEWSVMLLNYAKDNAEGLREYEGIYVP